MAAAPDPNRGPANRRALTATVGAGAVAMLISYVPQFEGMVLRGYKDPIGIVTACVGHTKTAVLGRPYTKAECENLLVTDLTVHAQGVKDCIHVPMTTGQWAASVSFAFNVGVANFCRSTMARKLNERDYAGACAELSKWTKAGGRELPGLVSRRRTERAMCEGKLEA